MLILGLLEISYKQTYSVSLNGKIIGYTKDKVTLQKKINDYITSGDGKNLAFVDLSQLPIYTACLLKKNVKTNDDEIFEKVTNSGEKYYRYYVLTVDNLEKNYVSTFSEAEEVVNKLKEKDSENKDKLGIIEKYTTASLDRTTSEEEDNSNEESNNENSDTTAEDGKKEKLSTVDETVDNLYVEKKVVATPKKSKSSYKNIGVQVDNSQSSVYTNLGVSLIRPVTSGFQMISSRFGWRSRDNHKGLDIAAKYGSPIYASCGGKVIASGQAAGYSGYGNVVVIQVGSITFIYGHCSAVYVTTGSTVVQGQHIAAVGSTGMSTGNHLHFEIRVNGSAVDPQNYVYN